MIDDSVRKWIIKALEDFKIASHELDREVKEVVTTGVCFHCQQAAEKLIKAYLVSKNIDFAKTHDLEHLLDLCSKQDEEFKKIDVGNLTSYAVHIRYPDDFYVPVINEARECFKIASNVKDFVLRKLQIKEEEI